MLSSFKYRIYPAEDQGERLKRTLASLCDLYNELRREKVNRYRQEKINLTKTDLRRLALQKRRSSEELKAIHSQVVQNVADRVSLAFRNFFEKRSRFPKYKKQIKYRSLVYPQSGFNIKPTLNGHKIYLSGIGNVRAFIHRPMTGKVNRLCIKNEAGEWYAVFLIEKEDTRVLDLNLVREERIRGGDLGLKSFITLDDSKSNEYPRFLRLSEEKIKLLQRRFSRKKKGSRRRRQLAFRLARLYLHVKRQREDYQNKLISTLLDKNVDVLVLEKLSTQNMLQNRNLSKSLADASFGKFATRCVNKARMLGKQIIFVDPWGTSQFCYNCLEWVPKDLGEREHKCPRCGVNLPRDLNSAKLIKWLGIQRSPPSDGGSSLAELLPLPSLRGMVSQSVEARSLRIPS